MSTDLTRTNDIIDPLLWRDAQHIIDRHSKPDEQGQCVWCGSHWPCPPRRLADLALATSSRPWPEAAPPADGPASQDLNDPRALPRWRTDEHRPD